MGTTEYSSPKWLRRLAWLGGIWLASVASLYLLALLLRFFMNAAGLGR